MGTWRKFHSSHRTFGGKKYDLERSGITTKREAQQMAKELKKRGRLVRIVRWEASNLPVQYLLYARFK